MASVYFAGPSLYSLDTVLAPVLDYYRFSPGSKIAVKVHMGEYGNLHYLRPSVVERIVQLLKDMDLLPFLFDTPTLYAYRRHTAEGYYQTARRHGYTAETIGCPIIISDDSVGIEIPYSLERVGVPTDLLNADGLLVVSHFKGHRDAGFGGAIKNLGMGCVDMETKRRMHLELSQPIVSDKCLRCSTCIETCPAAALSMQNRVMVDAQLCYGCGLCEEVCPENAIAPRVASVRSLLAEAAFAVTHSAGHERLLFLNAVIDVTDWCDCWDRAMQRVVEDVGFFASVDAVAIDQSCLDAVNRGASCDIFRKIHRLDPEVQLHRAQDMGIGSREYDLVSIAA
jgi:uncharacterized Fe-S center protein